MRSCAFIHDEKRDAVDLHKPVLNLHHTHRKVRVALFVEYFTIFLMVMWICIVLCVYTHFRERNCIPAVSDSDTVRNRKVI